MPELYLLTPEKIVQLCNHVWILKIVDQNKKLTLSIIYVAMDKTNMAIKGTTKSYKKYSMIDGTNNYITICTLYVIFSYILCTFIS